eukprot:m.452019 g.452019  ORF g.452019 m.452019 type:complete len:56 (+) comp20252_c0_seq1:103-270(+)
MNARVTVSDTGRGLLSGNICTWILLLCSTISQDQDRLFGDIAPTHEHRHTAVPVP